MEDALLTQAGQNNEALKQLQILGEQVGQLELALGATLEDNKAYNILTTTPELLADYVNEFFGPNGVVPVELPQDRLRADVAAAEAARPMQQPQQGFQRPQMEIPSPGARQAPAEDFWGVVDQVSRRSPEQLWQILSQAPPGAFQQRLLISES